VVKSRKDLADIERDLRSIKIDDLPVRPARHRLDDRVKPPTNTTPGAIRYTENLKPKQRELRSRK
jgi:hypothetical protein